MKSLTNLKNHGRDKQVRALEQWRSLNLLMFIKMESKETKQKQSSLLFRNAHWKSRTQGEKQENREPGEKWHWVGTG